MSFKQRESVFTCDICGKTDEAFTMPDEWKVIALFEVHPRTKKLERLSSDHHACPVCWGKGERSCKYAYERLKKLICGLFKKRKG